MATWAKCTEEDDIVIHLNLDNVLFMRRQAAITTVHLVGMPEKHHLTVLETPEQIITNIVIP